MVAYLDIRGPSPLKKGGSTQKESPWHSVSGAVDPCMVSTTPKRLHIPKGHCVKYPAAWLYSRSLSYGACSRAIPANDTDDMSHPHSYPPYLPNAVQVYLNTSKQPSMPFDNGSQTSFMHSNCSLNAESTTPTMFRGIVLWGNRPFSWVPSVGLWQSWVWACRS